MTNVANELDDVPNEISCADGVKRSIIRVTQPQYNALWNALKPEHRTYADCPELRSRGFACFAIDNGIVVVDQWLPV